MPEPPNARRLQRLDAQTANCNIRAVGYGLHRAGRGQFPKKEVGMAAIRIIAPPPGEAPKWVRQAWVGLVLPLSENISPGIQLGALGGDPHPQNLDGYSVATNDALTVLARVNAEAAKWWRTEAFLGDYLVFSRTVCTVIN